MTEPRRLNRGSDELVVAMLRAAKREQPKPEGLRRALRATLVAGAAASGAKVAGAAALQLTATSVLKSLAIGVLGGTLAVGTGELLIARAPAKPASSARRPAPSLGFGEPTRLPRGARVEPIVRAPVLEATPIDVTPTPATRFDDGATVRAPSPKPVAARDLAKPPTQIGSKQDSAQSPQARESDLRRAVELVDRARALLARRDAGGALQTLSTYERETAGTLLRAEVLYLRMEALRAAGDAVGARRMAAALLEGYPNGVHAERVRAVLQSNEPRPSSPAPSRP